MLVEPKGETTYDPKNCPGYSIPLRSNNSTGKGIGKRENAEEAVKTRKKTPDNEDRSLRKIIWSHYHSGERKPDIRVPVPQAPAPQKGEEANEKKKKKKKFGLTRPTEKGQVPEKNAFTLSVHRRRRLAPATMTLSSK